MNFALMAERTRYMKENPKGTEDMRNKASKRTDLATKRKIACTFISKDGPGARQTAGCAGWKYVLIQHNLLHRQLFHLFCIGKHQCFVQDKEYGKRNQHDWNVKLVVRYPFHVFKYDRYRNL